MGKQTTVYISEIYLLSNYVRQKFILHINITPTHKRAKKKTSH